MSEQIGTELAPLMKSATTGKPRKDPDTGYMMAHNLPSTDVTRLAVNAWEIFIFPPPYDKVLLSSPQPWQISGNKSQYSDQLSGQVSEKLTLGARGREMEDVQQKQHFESWESFWGRPGNGAPRDSVQKENLMKMLHYADTEVKNVRIKFSLIGGTVCWKLKEIS